MISLTKAQVPDYLVGSEFYNSLSADENDEFSIPQECLKPTVKVSSASELKHLLNTFRFWGIHDLPYELMELLIFKSKPIADEERELIEDVLREFDPEFKLLNSYKNSSICANKSARMDAAIRCGRRDVLEYVYSTQGKACATLIKGAAENGCFDLLKRATDNYLQTHKRPFAIKHVMTTVASRGFSDCLGFLLEKGCTKDSKSLASTAAANGHLACIQVAHEQGCDVSRVAHFAALHGHLKCLQYAHSNIGEVEGSTACDAIRGGHIECLQFVLDQGVEPTETMCYAACLSGSLPCLQLLHARGAPWDVTCTKVAARNNHLSCLKFLMDEGCPTNSMVTCEAARGGHDACLNLLLEAGCKVQSNSVDAAAAGGHISCLKALHPYKVVPSACQLSVAATLKERGISYIQNLQTAGYRTPQCAISVATDRRNTAWVEYICKNRCCELNVEHTCAPFLDLSMLKLLHQFGCPWDERTCATAAAIGYSYGLERLQYVHEHGCPLDERTCAAAAGHAGGLDCLQYAHEQGCPWDASTTMAAARSNNLNTLSYALQNGCPCNVYTSLTAAANGRLRSLQLLHEHGCPWDESVSKAAADNNKTSCLRYCVEHGCPMSKATMNKYNRISSI